jgi:hypothetical protein
MALPEGDPFAGGIGAASREQRCHMTHQNISPHPTWTQHPSISLKPGTEPHLRQESVTSGDEHAAEPEERWEAQTPELVHGQSPLREMVSVPGQDWGKPCMRTLNWFQESCYALSWVFC